MADGSDAAGKTVNDAEQLEVLRVDDCLYVAFAIVLLYRIVRC